MNPDQGAVTESETAEQAVTEHAEASTEGVAATEPAAQYEVGTPGSSIKRGIASATTFHKENTGMLYPSFILKEDGASKTVRLLQDETQWVSLFVHRDFTSKIPMTRCASVTDEPDMENCLLCAYAVGRQLRTFIPVRVRGDENLERVQMIDYGRDNLLEVLNLLEEHVPKDSSITAFDVKIKRQGTKTDTKYRWIAAGNQRPLSDEEKKLVVPNMETILVVPSESKLKAFVARLVPAEDATEKKEAGSKTPF